MYDYQTSIYESLIDKTRYRIEELHNYFGLEEKSRDYSDYHPFGPVRLTNEGIEFQILSHQVVLRVKHYTALRSALFRTFLAEKNPKTEELEYTHFPSMDITLSMPQQNGMFFTEPKRLRSELTDQEYDVTEIHKFPRDYVRALGQCLKAHEQAEWRKLVESKKQPTTA